MEQVRLGRSGLKVSCICLGSMIFGAKILFMTGKLNRHSKEQGMLLANKFSPNRP